MSIFITFKKIIVLSHYFHSSIYSNRIICKYTYLYNAISSFNKLIKLQVPGIIYRGRLLCIKFLLLFALLIYAQFPSLILFLPLILYLFLTLYLMIYDDDDDGELLNFDK